MSNRFSFINFSIAIIFLFSAIFPPGAFSYADFSRDAHEKDLVDESKGMDIVSFKKIRCPNCLMEFFYIPGKDSPHSHWVQYEVKEDLDVDKEGVDIESNLKDNQDKIKELKKQDKFLGLFKLGSDAKDKKDTNESAAKKAISTQASKGAPEYKLRQQLTCPYDSYVFFPEGDLPDQTKSKSMVPFYQEPSLI